MTDHPYMEVPSEKSKVMFVGPGKVREKMFSFYTNDGEEFSGQVRQGVELILGDSTQCVSRGAVELENGEVRIFTIRRPNHANLKGHTMLLSDPICQTFGMAVASLTRMEYNYLTDIKSWG